MTTHTLRIQITVTLPEGRQVLRGMRSMFGAMGNVLKRFSLAPGMSSLEADRFQHLSPREKAEIYVFMSGIISR